MLMAAMLLGVYTGCCTATRSATAPPPPLEPLYAALYGLEGGHRTNPVNIVQIGDSHTANDGFSGLMRERFQARFGDAGRGMLPPGFPFKFYHPAQVTVTATGWHAVSSMDHRNAGPFGIAGVRAAADKPADMSLRTTTLGAASSVWVESLGQPRGGTITAQVDNGPVQRFPTASATGAPLWLHLPNLPDGATLHLRAVGDGPVDLLSWTVQRAVPGVTYSNLGTIGARIDLLGRFDPALVRAELDRLHPALMLIAFGTNEGFDDSTNMATYPAVYAARVQALHEAAPYAALVIIGPPDGNRESPPDTGRVCHGDAREWHVPPRLAEVRDAQERFAKDHGYFYWDWSAAMGGACSMRAWAAMKPPMSAADHMHLVRLGYRATASQLFDAIIAGYPHYRDTHAH
jgi:lysophospholipase L1-like esterase